MKDRIMKYMLSVMFSFALFFVSCSDNRSVKELGKMETLMQEDPVKVLETLENIDERTLKGDKAKALLREELDRRYFTPVITRLTGVKEKFGYFYWDAETTAGKVSFVRGGIMAENTLAVQMGQGCDLLADIRLFFGNLEANAAHARIYGKMEGGSDTCTACSLRQKLCFLQVENSGTDACSHDLPVGIYGGMS